MTDCAAEFIKKFAGDDPDVLVELEPARERIDAGKEIYLLREELGCSREEFAEILGMSSADEVRSIELGNFEESGLEKLVQVDAAIRDWQCREKKRRCNLNAALKREHHGTMPA